MTAIVAIENANLDEKVIIQSEDIDTYGSSIYLKVGNTLSLKDLVYGLMLRSGNDASLAIARSVSGSVENFVNLMNKKAKELGMNNSVFNNPSGLDANEEGNFSTSYDLALVMSYAIKNELFCKIIGAKEYKSEIGKWKNKNKLLTSYKYNLGGKTGFTNKAKRTLVTASKKDNTTLVVVTLDCGNDFNFHKFLYNKNFEKYESIKVLSEGENHIEDFIVTCLRDIVVTVEKENIKEYKIIHKIGKEGDSKVFLEDYQDRKLVGECSVKKNEVIQKSWFKSLLNKINFFK
jgi:D-alanyl-D-alanine carboxypeptidase